MSEDDWRYTIAATVSRIEQKVDSVNEALVAINRRIDVIEERVWGLSGTKLGTATLLSIMVVIATVAAAIGTMFPHVFGIRG